MDKNSKKQLETINRQINEIVGIYRCVLGRTGISENEFWVWYALIIIGGEYSQQDISEMWCITKQTVNAIVTNMVKKGYVELETIPGTRNKKIKLTSAGKEYGEGVVRPMVQTEERSFDRLPANVREECINALGKYISILKEEMYETYGK